MPVKRDWLCGLSAGGDMVFLILDYLSDEYGAFFSGRSCFFWRKSRKFMKITVEYTYAYAAQAC